MMAVLLTMLGLVRLHPEVISVLVHVEPDEPQHRKQDGHTMAVPATRLERGLE